jgi:sugar-specific transcriptional regulator TrmB
MDEKELISQLTKFGVTSQEAAVLLLLVRIRNSGAGGMTGNSLSELSKLGRVRTYQVLQRLADMGLVEVDFGRPKRYAAVIPQIVVRRLLAVHESKLTELTHIEEDVAKALIGATPLNVDAGPEGKERSNVVMLHGLSSIQSLVRSVTEGQDLRMIVNDESEGHLFTTIEHMSRRPKSAKVIFATLNEEQEGFEGNRVEIGGYRYRIKLYRGELPTMVITQKQCLMLFYASQRYRPKPLSPVTVRTVVSECLMIDNAKYVSQVETIFEKFWRLSS